MGEGVHHREVERGSPRRGWMDDTPHTPPQCTLTQPLLPLLSCALVILHRRSPTLCTLAPQWFHAHGSRKLMREAWKHESFKSLLAEIKHTSTSVGHAIRHKQEHLIIWTSKLDMDSFPFWSYKTQHCRSFGVELKFWTTSWRMCATIVKHGSRQNKIVKVLRHQCPKKKFDSFILGSIWSVCLHVR